MSLKPKIYSFFINILGSLHIFISKCLIYNVIFQAHNLQVSNKKEHQFKLKVPVGVHPVSASGCSE